MYKIIIFLCITTCVFAEERIKIAKILDNNHYITTKGDTISPAFVRCIERDPQKPEWNWLVEETHDYLRDSFRTFKILVKKDSLFADHQVHIYRKLPLGRESLNYNLLKNGYGKLVDGEHAPALYVQAAQEARRKYWGIYRQESPKFSMQYRNAIWATVGKGGGFGFARRASALPIFPYMQSSITLRHQKYAFNFTYDVIGKINYDHLSIYKLGIGLASHRQGSEINIVLGPSLYTTEETKTYQAENMYKSKKVTQYHIGLHIKTQTFAYFFNCIGGGLSASAMMDSDFFMFTISFDLGAGLWFHPIK